MTDSEKIEILIDQVGRLSESITAMRMSIESGFGELKAASERQERNIERQGQNIDRLAQSITEFRIAAESEFSDLKAVSERQERNIERQERNIDRLVGIVETLISRQA